MPLDLIIWIIGFVSLLFAILVAPGLLRSWRARQQRIHGAVVTITNGIGETYRITDFRGPPGRFYVNGEPRELPTVVNPNDVVTYEFN